VVCSGMHDTRFLPYFFSTFSHCCAGVVPTGGGHEVSGGQRAAERERETEYLEEVEGGDVGECVLVVLQILDNDLQRLLVVIMALHIHLVSRCRVRVRVRFCVCVCVSYLGKVERVFKVARLSAHLDRRLDLEFEVRPRLYRATASAFQLRYTRMTVTRTLMNSSSFCTSLSLV